MNRKVSITAIHYQEKGERKEQTRMVGVDVSGLDRDETGRIRRSRSETLAKEFRDDLDELRVQPREALELLQIMADHEVDEEVSAGPPPFPPLTQREKRQRQQNVRHLCTYGRSS
jgi:hypothetical protein